MRTLYPSLIIATPLRVSLELQASATAIVGSAFTRKRPTERFNGASPLLRRAARQVTAYFARRLDRFDVPLEFEGTPFQRTVWEIVSGLHFGEIVSYRDVAYAAGKPNAYRAVAAAMTRSPLDLLIPAHRVVGSDGTVRGAAAGSTRRKLLAFEGIRLH